MSAPCRRNISRLVALLSGSLRPRAAEKLRAHLERCPGCATAFDRLQKTAALCRSLGAAPAPTLPWRQIEAQVNWRLQRQDETAAVAGRKLRLLPVGVALAIALLVGAGVGLLVGSNTRRQLPSTAKITTAPRPATQFPTAPASPDEELAAVVTVAQGEVSVISSKGQALPLSLSRPVLQGERVLTSAGHCALQWEAGTGVLVGNDSEAELRQLRISEQEINLWRGQVAAAVSHRQPGQRFSIVADGLRARVMGTFFSVKLDEQTVAVEVQEGKVLVESLESHFPAVEVPAGMSLRVPRRGHDRRPALGRGSRPVPLSLLNLLAWPSFQRVMAGTGLIALESQPAGADVVFDTHPLGSTNLTMRSTLGRHLVELWRDGKLVSKQWVDVQLSPGRLAIDIRPRPAPSPRPVRLPVGLHEVFRARAVQIQACYERRLKNNPELEGRLTLRLGVDKNGRVSSASLDTDTVPDPSVGQCALAVVRRWQFPAGAEAELVYPFQFRPR